jgi:hypothetical protein
VIDKRHNPVNVHHLQMGVRLAAGTCRQDSSVIRNQQLHSSSEMVWELVGASGGAVSEA